MWVCFREGQCTKSQRGDNDVANGGNRSIIDAGSNGVGAFAAVATYSADAVPCVRRHIGCDRREPCWTQLDVNFTVFAKYTGWSQCL